MSGDSQGVVKEVVEVVEQGIKIDLPSYKKL